MSLHELAGPRQPYACLLVLGLSHAYGVRTLQLLPTQVLNLLVQPKSKERQIASRNAQLTPTTLNG